MREIADKLGLATAHRKDSQGICFVGKVHLPTFLQQKLESKKGSIIEINDNSIFPATPEGLPDDKVSEESLQQMTRPFRYDPSYGDIIGEHNGAHFFTIGQRKGMNVGGHKEALFVIGTDVEKNIIYTGEGHEPSRI